MVGILCQNRWRSAQSGRSFAAGAGNKRQNVWAETRGDGLCGGPSRRNTERAGKALRSKSTELLIPARRRVFSVTFTHLAFHFRSYLIERRIANSTSRGGLAEAGNPLVLPEICKETEILQRSSGCDSRTGMF